MYIAARIMETKSHGLSCLQCLTSVMLLSIQGKILISFLSLKKRVFMTEKFVLRV